VTDIHYADKAAGGAGATRHYRESPAKLGECVAFMNRAGVSFLCELGDFKDQDNSPAEASTLSYLRTIESVFRGFKRPRHHVLGNHDLDSISKAQFLAVTGSPAGYYSFDHARVHFVVLDACFTAAGRDYDHGDFDWRDAALPAKELQWLAADLARTRFPAVALIHQRLDGEGPAFVRNAAEVRRLLEGSGKVLAVFQGHDHPGGYSRIQGIHYYTLKALVEGSGAENSAYAVIEVRDNGDIAVAGHRRATSMDFSLPGPVAEP